MTTIIRDIAIPASVKPKMRAHAITSNSTLGDDVAAIITRYAEGGYTDGEGVHLDDVADPGVKASDVKVRLNIEESVWQQARTRTVLDGTTLASVVRRLTIALNGDES